MKTVDIIFDQSLDAIIGPVQTIKRILNNRDFFKENGFEITSFTQDIFKDDSIVLQVKNHETPIVLKLKQFAKFLKKKSFLYSYLRYRASLAGSKKLINYYLKQNRNPDIVVFHGIFDCYLFMKMNTNKNIKTCLFTHSDGLMHKQYLDGFPKLKNTFVERDLMQMANFVFDNLTINPCIAKIEEKNHHRLFPQTIGKTCLVVNAIDDLSDEEKLIANNIRKENIYPKYKLVCAGGFTGRKGQKTIIEAIHRIKPELLKLLHVELIGDGQMRVPYQDLVNKYGLSDIIELPGKIPNVDIYKHLAKADIFVLMSDNEGLPIALLEAIRSGLAIISTNVSGIPEVAIEGKNGILLNNSVDELVDVLNNIDSYDWENMKRESRKLFEEYYTFPRMRSDYLNMLIMAFNK